MRKIIVKEARPGMCAARAVANPERPDAPCVPTGDVLTMTQIIQMHELGIYDLWINDPGLDFFDDVCSSQPTTAQLRLAEALRDSFLRLSGCVSRALFRRYEPVLAELIQSLTRTAPVVPCFVALTEDESLLAHSCDSCAVASLLGLQLESYLIDQRRRLNCRQAREIQNLALGALFHDVGELLLPAHQRESNLRSSGVLGMEGATCGDEWKQHTDDGYASVHGRIDPSAAVVVQHHHQHFDGTGFAGGGALRGGAGITTPKKGMPAERPGQSGAGIHVHTRIATVADVFSHQLFAGGARMPQPMIKTLWQLQQAPMRQWFDPVVLQGFLTMLPPFTEGMVVTLNDRRQAVVTKTEPHSPCCPQVRILGGLDRISELQLEGMARGGIGMATSSEVRLVDSPGVEIVSVDGSEVLDFHYGTRPGRPLAA